MQVYATKNFRQNLRVAMKVEGISQRKLASIARLSYPFINRILMGRAIPDLDVCEKLAGKVGYPLTVLLLPPKEFLRRVPRSALAG